MTTRYLGASIARNEDRRLLNGRALFVNDVERPGMLHVAFLRSPHAHARLGAVDLLPVRARQGVVAAYAADDLGDYWKPGPPLMPPPPVEGAIFSQQTQVPLARDKVRHVGEPVATVVAESRYIAEDALASIGVEYGPLPAVTDLEIPLHPSHFWELSA
jgi:CO/xanthine dehydrogenase Mo-binding subunit